MFIGIFWTGSVRKLNVLYSISIWCRNFSLTRSHIFSPTCSHTWNFSLILVSTFPLRFFNQSHTFIKVVPWTRVRTRFWSDRIFEDKWGALGRPFLNLNEICSGIIPSYYKRSFIYDSIIFDAHVQLSFWKINFIRSLTFALVIAKWKK